MSINFKSILNTTKTVAEAVKLNASIATECAVSYARSEEVQAMKANILSNTISGSKAAAKVAGDVALTGVALGILGASAAVKAAKDAKDNAITKMADKATAKAMGGAEVVLNNAVDNMLEILRNAANGQIAKESDPTILTAKFKEETGPSMDISYNMAMADAIGHDGDIAEEMEAIVVDYEAEKAAALAELTATIANDPDYILSKDEIQMLLDAGVTSTTVVINGKVKED